MNVVQLQPKRRTNEPSFLPDGFFLSPELRAWANGKGITKVSERMEHFVDVCLAKGYKYIDWNAAFRNACRQDWAKLGPPSQVTLKTCCRCHKELINGHTKTRDGDMCSDCWNNR